MRAVAAADLADRTRFRQLDTLYHDDLAPFLLEYYSQRRTWLTVVHYVLTMAAGAAVALAGFAGGYTLSGWFIAAFLGLAAFVALMPIHEGLHAIVYLALGARDLRAFFVRRYLAVYVIAPDFVVSGGELALLALAPFLAVNLVLLVAAIAGFPDRVFALAALALHVAGTSGDWALLNYLWLHRGQQVYTYDDAGEGETYFFAATGAGASPHQP